MKPIVLPPITLVQQPDGSLARADQATHDEVTEHVLRQDGEIVEAARAVEREVQKSIQTNWQHNPELAETLEELDDLTHHLAVVNNRGKWFLGAVLGLLISGLAVAAVLVWASYYGQNVLPELLERARGI